MKYPQERIQETVPLLSEAWRHMGSWIEFQTDDGPLLKRVIYWLTHDDASPLVGKRPFPRYLVEWRLPGDQWTRDVTASPVMGEQGRVGRFRWRPPKA